MPLSGPYTDILTNKQDDVSIVTGTDAGTTTNVGDHAAHHNALAAAANGLASSWVGHRVFNIEEYGAVADEFYLDGVTIGSDATFTSATANFVAADVGRQILILRGGDSSAQDRHTTIASINSTTSVELTHTAGRTQNPARFYISRGGTSAANAASVNDTAIAAAITAAYDAHGGIVLFPGVGYVTSNPITLKRRVIIEGNGPSFRGTYVHLIAGAAGPVVKNDQTLNNSADHCGIRNIFLDGNGGNQTDFTSTLAAAYTAGNTTISITAAPPQPIGSILIGTNRLHYTSITGAGPFTLNGVVGGVEDTLDANASNGATVTQHHHHGVQLGPIPYNAMSEGVGPGAENFDPRYWLEHVACKNVRGNGFEQWGLSGAVYMNCWALYTYHHGYRTAFDTLYLTCWAEMAGRNGFYVRSTQCRIVECDSIYSGNVTNADGHGYFVEGATLLETGQKQVVACTAQDNKAHGLYVKNAQRVLAQMTCDSNNVSGTAGQYAAVKLDGATNGIFDVLCVERKQDGVNAKQQHALHLASTNLQCEQNQIRLSHAGQNLVGVGAAIKPGSDLSALNDININGAQLSPWKPPVRVATTANIAPSTDPETTLSAQATAGVTSFTVTSAAAIAIYDRLLMTPATTAEQVTVTGVSGSTITIAAPLLNTHVNGAPVRNISRMIAGGTTLTVDGVAVANNNRVLLKTQTLPWQNGIYRVTGIGTSVILHRAQDGNEDFHFNQGVTLSVPEGTTQADQVWQMTTNYPIVYGNTSLVFAPIAPKVKFTTGDLTDAIISGLTTMTDLDFAVAANTDYTFTYIIPFRTATTTTGLTLAMSAPASPTSFGYQAVIPFAADGAAGTWMGSGTTNDDLISATGHVATGTTYIAMVQCCLRNGANAGTVSIKFTAEAATTITIVKGATGIMYVT